MALTISHTTTYRFETPVAYALQKIRLRPLSNAMQDVLSWNVDISGGKIEASYRDHYGNHVDLVSADVGALEMTVTAYGQVAPFDRSGVLGTAYGRAPLWHFTTSTALTKAGPEVLRLSKVIATHENTLDGLHALSAAILAEVSYETSQTTATTTAEQAIAIGKGVCQDHSHIFISAARAAGIPARYVSGYLAIDGQIEQQASHAWAEAHVPELGWVGFDVSNIISPDQRYVRIAIGRDGQDAAPISGLRMGSGEETLIVSLQVQQ